MFETRDYLFYDNQNKKNVNIIIFNFSNYYTNNNILKYNVIDDDNYL